MPGGYRPEMPEEGWAVEYLEEGRDGLSRWRLWWIYDSQHGAECAAGLLLDRKLDQKVRIRYEKKSPGTLF